MFARNTQKILEICIIVFSIVQLIRSIGENQTVDFETGVGVGSGMVEDDEAEDQDLIFQDTMLSGLKMVRESVKSY